MVSIIWRHADAERGGRDEERRLTVKGRKQAKRVAAWLREWLPRDATVLTNSILRLGKKSYRRTSGPKVQGRCDPEVFAGTRRGSLAHCGRQPKLPTPSLKSLK